MTGHGRRARRTVKLVLAPPWIGFEGAAQVAQLRHAVVTKGTKTVEVTYLITSDRSASPETLAAWVRGHWHIENKLHWVRDVTYQEDKSLVRTGNAPRVMAMPVYAVAPRPQREDDAIGITSLPRMPHLTQPRPSAWLTVRTCCRLSAR